MPLFTRFARYYEEVAKQQSIRKASQALNISPSAVDRQILLAEQELGFALFHRRAHGVTLTPAGERLLHASHRLQREFLDVLEEIAALEGEGVRSIDIALTEAFSSPNIGALIGGFITANPAVAVNIHTLGVGDARDLVLSGGADIAVTFMSSGVGPQNVLHEVDLDIGLCFEPVSPLSDEQTIPLFRCADLPIIVPQPATIMSRYFMDAIATEGIQLMPKARAGTAANMKSMVLNGVGLGVTTKAHVMWEIEKGDLQFRPLHSDALKPVKLALIVATARKKVIGELSNQIIDVMNELAALSNISGN